MLIHRLSVLRSRALALFVLLLILFGFGGVLSQQARAQQVVTKTANATAVPQDCDPTGNKVIVFNINSAGIYTLPVPGTTSGFFGQCRINVLNLNANTLTLNVPTSPANINGLPSITLAIRKGAIIYTDGTPAATGVWYAIGQ